MREFSKEANQTSYPFILPDLPYSPKALEPYLSSETLDYHHKKHHQTYVTNLNNLIKDHELSQHNLETIVSQSSRNELAGVFNNAAQVWNHTFYWHCMKPNGGGKPSGQLYEKICQDFADFDSFAQEFKQVSLGQFGSGWSWLVIKDNKLSVTKTANANNPILEGAFPLMVCDVWEHAYYIDYRNKRAEYVQIFLEKLVNWDFVAQNFARSQE